LSGEVTYIKGDFAEFPYLAAKSSTAKGCYLQVHVPLAAGQESPVMETTQLEDGQVVRIALERGVTDTVAVSGGGAAWESGLLSSDARFAWVRDDGTGVYECAARDATFLSIGDGTGVRFQEPTSFAAK